jgi:hypothetical protein
MATTTSPNLGPRMVRTSNTPLYWGVAILAAVLIGLALLMKPTKVSTATTATDVAATAQGLDTTPATNASRSQSIDPASGRAYATDPRAEQLHNGANSPNGGIAPNNNPASQPPNTSPSGY